jgi:hypothetical protein
VNASAAQHSEELEAVNAKQKRQLYFWKNCWHNYPLENKGMQISLFISVIH